MVVLVRNEITLDVNIKYNLLASLPAIIIICVFFRKIFRWMSNSPHQDIIHIFMDTWGTFLSTHLAYAIHNRPERVMNITVLLLSILTWNIVTAVTFKYLLAQPLQGGIDTKQELAESGLAILVNDEYMATMDEWTNGLKYVL